MDETFSEIKTVKDIKGIFVNIFPIFFKTKKTIGIFSMCAYRYDRHLKKESFDKYLVLREEKFPIKTLFKKGIRVPFKKYNYYFNIYKVSIECDKLVNNPPQNLCKVNFINDDTNLVMPMIYNLIYYTKYLGFVGPLYKYKNHDLACYFRQTKKNSIGVTVRSQNVTDSPKEKIKIFFAKLLSCLTPKSNIILLYEKEANKYEESAMVVYERLIDMGYNNAHFIIRKESAHNEFIKPKYQKNIIYAFTFKHYYSFFKCHKFIGTESVPHSIELRAANKYITRKFIKKDYKQVFLQHGVMYMVALNPKSRGAFLKGVNEMPMDVKVVVSSDLEAKHFIDLANYEKEDLYVTGLPSYDRNIKKEDADKITIMLTARLWELNLLESDYKKSKYYQMLKKIIKNVPKELRDKVYVIPHPLLLERFKNTDIKVPDILSYDKILEETNLLITDYSSIAYSAFYRGSNVIFCWEELDECMKQFHSHLMLNDKNAFGDISYEFEDLGKLIKDNYLKPQSKKYQNRYHKIVEFHDNHNTDRLIEYLKRDHII